MKFTDEKGLNLPGITAYGCARILDKNISADTASFFISPFVLLEISSPFPDVMRIKLSRYKRDIKKTDEHAIKSGETLEFFENDNTYTIRQGRISATLRKGRFGLTFSYGGNILTGSGFEQAAILTSSEGFYIRELLDLEADELIYGLGGRSTPFVKNGQSVDKPGVPFYLSSKGYGVFAESASQISFEVDSAEVNKVQFSTSGEELSYFIIGGGNAKAAISNFCKLTGRAKLPPAWSFGLWVSDPSTSSHDKETLKSFVTELNSRGIPISGFHKDSFWMLDYDFCNFMWNEEAFPETEFAKLDSDDVFDSVYVARSSAEDVKQYPAHRDGGLTFSDMSEKARSSLSLAASGVSFWRHDIPSLEECATADVYKRWLAFGTFSAYTRLHTGISLQEAWDYDPECAEVLRYFAKLKESLLPYYFSEAVKSVKTGVPLIRPMALQYGSDPICHTLERQYMLGDSMLTAPVLTESGSCTVYLPEGRFTNFFTKEVISGGRLVLGKYNYLSLPVFIPENTLLPVSRGTGQDTYDDVTVNAYQLTDQTIDLYDKTGTHRASINGRRSGDDVAFQVEGHAPGLKFLVHN